MAKVRPLVFLLAVVAFQTLQAWNLQGSAHPPVDLVLLGERGVDASDESSPLIGSPDESSPLMEPLKKASGEQSAEESSHGDSNEADVHVAEPEGVSKSTEVKLLNRGSYFNNNCFLNSDLFAAWAYHEGLDWIFAKPSDLIVAQLAKDQASGDEEIVPIQLRMHNELLRVISSMREGKATPVTELRKLMQEARAWKERNASTKSSTFASGTHASDEVLRFLVENSISLLPAGSKREFAIASSTATHTLPGLEHQYTPLVEDLTGKKVGGDNDRFAFQIALDPEEDSVQAALMKLFRSVAKASFNADKYTEMATHADAEDTLGGSLQQFKADIAKGNRANRVVVARQGKKNFDLNRYDVNQDRLENAWEHDDYGYKTRMYQGIVRNIDSEESSMASKIKLVKNAEGTAKYLARTLKNNGKSPPTQFQKDCYELLAAAGFDTKGAITNALIDQPGAGDATDEALCTKIERELADSTPLCQVASNYVGYHFGYSKSMVSDMAMCANKEVLRIEASDATRGEKLKAMIEVAHNMNKIMLKEHGTQKTFAANYKLIGDYLNAGFSHEEINTVVAAINRERKSASKSPLEEYETDLQAPLAKLRMAAAFPGCKMPSYMFPDVYNRLAALYQAGFTRLDITTALRTLTAGSNGCPTDINVVLDLALARARMAAVLPGCKMATHAAFELFKHLSELYQEGFSHDDIMEAITQNVGASGCPKIDDAAVIKLLLEGKTVTKRGGKSYDFANALDVPADSEMAKTFKSMDDPHSASGGKMYLVSEPENEETWLPEVETMKQIVRAGDALVLTSDRNPSLSSRGVGFNLNSQLDLTTVVADGIHTIWDLESVVLHNGGHYVSLSRYEDGKWYFMNDVECDGTQDCIEPWTAVCTYLGKSGCSGTFEDFLSGSHAALKKLKRQVTVLVYLPRPNTEKKGAKVDKKPATITSGDASGDASGDPSGEASSSATL